MTLLHFYQGLRTIGGTVVEIETEDARCLFDFGLVFQGGLSEAVSPRPDRLTADCLALGRVPAVDGLYSRAQLGTSAPRPWEDETRPVFMLISHMHIDHMGALGLLAPEIPVYMTRESLALYEALCRMGAEPYGAHANCLALPADGALTVGSIRVETFPVDHDVPGACGFYIRTPDGTVCYTGDLRLHGFHGEATLAFARQVKNCDVCITEGVTASFIEDFDAVVPTASCDGLCMTEEQALAEMGRAFRETRGIVFLNAYERNLERMERLVDAARECGRTLVLDAVQAFLLDAAVGVRGLPVYAPFDAPFAQALQAPRLGREALLAHPERYVLTLPFARLLEALDFDAASSLYIHADGVPLGEYDPRYGLLLQFLAARGIPRAALGTGGHASPEHLKRILETIAPRVLVPLHSLRPELIRIDGAEQLLPEPYSAYRLQNHTLQLVDR